MEYNVVYKYNISIHALREESDRYHNDFIVDLECISIHALREESDFLSH